MPVGLGGGGAVGIAIEATPGTWEAPDVWVPIISEEFQYNESRYYSPQIREETIVSDVQQGYYHIEGPIVMEADPNFLPYFLYATRHSADKSGTGPPYTYTFTPSQVAAVYAGGSEKTLSVTIKRNDQWFGYAGCVVGSFEATVEEGVDRFTWNMLGLSESEPADQTPTWTAPTLYGASTHSVYLDASGLTPAFASADVNHNGFTLNVNFNATPQNRIVASRAATYISFGETEVTYNTELDFIDRTEYDLYVAATQKAFRYQSMHSASNWAAATDGWRVTCLRSVYDTYPISLGAMGDLVMAGVTARVIGITGGEAYSIEVVSNVSITP